ncbi:MAG: OsmC family protein [Anaerolineae bacterium]
MSTSWTVRVRADGPDDATAHVRQHTLRVGAAAGFDAEAPLPSAVETLIGALGADLLSTFGAAARRARVPLDALEIVLTGALDNPLVHLGVIGEEGSPRIAAIDGTLYVACDAAVDDIERLWDTARARSPLYATLGRSVALNVRLCPTP